MDKIEGWAGWLRLRDLEDDYKFLVRLQLSTYGVTNEFEYLAFCTNPMVLDPFGI
jgi:hypothetical protein